MRWKRRGYQEPFDYYLKPEYVQKNINCVSLRFEKYGRTKSGQYRPFYRIIFWQENEMYFLTKGKAHLFILARAKSKAIFYLGKMKSQLTDGMIT